MVRLLLLASALLVGSAVALLLVADQQEGDQPGRRVAPAGVTPRTASSVVVEDTIPRRSLPSPLVEGRRQGTAEPRSWKARGVPGILHIGSLGTHAPVLPIEANGGVLMPPEDPTMVGWWRDGALPGAAYGSAVITGHTLSTGGGVFDNLDRLRAGDDIRLKTSNGVLTYVVDSIAAYPKQSLAEHARQVFSQSVPGRLVLVTCEDWNGEVYLSNQIVFARPA